MKKTQGLYEQFQKAILTGSPEIAAPSIKPHPRMDAKLQAAIYSNGYMIRMRQAIESDYPALAALLGEQGFKKLAAGFIASHPSVYYNLDDYTQGFAAYASKHTDEFAAELAQLEQAIAYAFNAPETPALTPDALANLSPEAFGAMPLTLRASLRLLAFAYPVNGWLDAQRNGSLPDVPAPKESWVCVLRHNNEVQRIVLEKPAFILLSSIGQGATVAVALEEVAAECPDQLEMVAKELQPWFSAWVAGGVFAA